MSLIRVGALQQIGPPGKDLRNSGVAGLMVYELSGVAWSFFILYCFENG